MTTFFRDSRESELETVRQLGLFWGLFSVSVLLMAPFAGVVTGVLPGCAFESLFGWPCPTCGSKSAAYHLARLDPVAAVRSSPLATLVWIVVIGGGFAFGAGALTGREGRPVKVLAGILERFDYARQRRFAFALLACGTLNWLYLLAAARV